MQIKKPDANPRQAVKVAEHSEIFNFKLVKAIEEIFEVTNNVDVKSNK